MSDGVMMPAFSVHGLVCFFSDFSCSSRENLEDLSPVKASHLTFKPLNVRKARQTAVSGAGGVNGSLCAQKGKVGKRVDSWSRAWWAVRRKHSLV